MIFKSIEHKKNTLEYKSIMNRVAISLIVFTVLINVLYFLVFTLEYLILDINVMDEGSFAFTLISCTLEALAYALSFILPVVIYFLISRNKPHRKLNFSFNIPKKSWLYMLVALAMTRVASYLNAILVELFSYPMYDEIEKIPMKPYELVFNLLLVALIPAVTEELLFRGVIAENLKPYGKGVALIVSAVLFGFMHQNISQLLYTSVAGLTLGYIYLKTDSLYGCMIFHFFNNAQSTVSEYIYNNFSDESYYIFETISMLVIVTSGLVALLLLIFTNKSNRSDDYGYYGKSKMLSVDYAEKRIDEVDAAKGFFCIANIIFMIISVIAMQIPYYY